MNFLDQLLLPSTFYGRDMWGMYFFIFASCEPLKVNDPIWPLGDLWSHFCCGHMGDSTQVSLCLSLVEIHQSKWIQWLFFKTLTTIPETTACTYYVLHTEKVITQSIFLTKFRWDKYYVQNEQSNCLFFWTKFRQDKKSRPTSLVHKAGRNGF